MNNLLDSLTGIDSTVQPIQKDLFDDLASKWSGDIAGYGRVYKNIENSTDDIPKYYKSSKIFIPEWWNSEKKDYEEVFYDDNFSCVFCFLVGDNDTTKDGVVYTTKAKVVFMVDLSKIYPKDEDEPDQKQERLDAKAQRDAIEILRYLSPGIFEIKGIDKGVDFVFTGYTTLGIRFNDMQPLHCFSVNIDLYYYLTDKCS